MDVRRTGRAGGAAIASVRGGVPALPAMRAFASAAEHGSFSRAAEAIGVTHGAIIHHIKSLERRLGVPLIERGPRSLRLTAEGVELYQRMVDPLRQLETVFRPRERARRRLVLTTVPSFATAWLMPRIGELLPAAPGVELVIKTELAVVDMREESVDLAIRLGEGPWDGLGAQKLASDEVFAVGAASYPLLRRVATPADLARATLIDNPLLPWSRWLNAIGSSDIRVQNRIEVADSHAAQLAAEGGAGIALARRIFARRALSSGRLVRLFEESHVPRQAWWAVWRPSNPKLDSIRALIGAIQRVLQTDG